MDKGVLQNMHVSAAAGLVAGDEAARKIVALSAEIKEYMDGRPYRILENGNIETVERLLAQPTFRRGDVSFYEGLTFSRFVNRFKNSTTVLFADAIEKKFTAILDYHPDGVEQGTALWDLFRAYLPLQLTESWKTWATANKTPMSQGDFAEFLESNIPDIAEPGGAKLVEIARSLEAKVDVQYASHIRAEDGSHKFTFNETVAGTSSGGVSIPAEITLALQPFEGSKVYQINARFRYRVASGKVAMWFDLVRMQDTLKAAFDDELVKIYSEINTSGGVAGALTPIYNGPAPVAQQPKD